MAIALALLVIPAAAQQAEESELNDTTALTDPDEVPCMSCHTEEAVLSPSHPSVMNMTMKDCVACHVPGGEMALPQGMHLDHHHYMAGLDCASCHDNPDNPMEPPMETCLSCHGTLDELGALTADVSPENPHDSPHGSPYADCSLCHVQHGPSENFCAQCHNFNFDPP